MPHTKITQAYVDGLPFSDATIWHHDTELAGFNLAVGKRTRTFYAASETQGRFLRVKIGRSDLVRVNVARDLARNVLLPEIRAGVDPRTKHWSQDDDARTAMSQEARTALRAIRFQEKVERKARVLRDDPRPQPGQVETFAQTWHEYRHFGSKAKSSTLTEYERTLKVHVPDWFERATVEITPQDVLTTWRRLSRSSIVTAKALMRVVSAVMHDPQSEHPREDDAHHRVALDAGIFGDEAGGQRADKPRDEGPKQQRQPRDIGDHHPRQYRMAGGIAHQRPALEHQKTAEHRRRRRDQRDDQERVLQEGKLERHQQIAPSAVHHTAPRNAARARARAASIPCLGARTSASRKITVCRQTITPPVAPFRK